MPFVEVEDGRLYYDVSGKGPSLVLIHGAWASHEWWRWQVPELSRDYQVLSIDVGPLIDQAKFFTAQHSVANY